MDHFPYINGQMMAEDVSLVKIAETVGTPVYVYSTATLQRHLRVFREAFGAVNPLICYAVKANSNQAVLATLAADGAGADVVSEGELKRALMAGIPAEKIVFSGVAKTVREMEQALKAGIKCFNVESEPELERLSAVAVQMDKVAPVSIRINPDVDARTHAKISTGKAENKFGIPWQHAEEIYSRIKALPNVEAVGIDAHIGSQLTDLEPFKLAFERLAELVMRLRGAGHTIHHLDLGGGLGIPYNPDESAPPLPSEYGEMVINMAKDLDCELVFEPGRLIAGNAGILLTKVEYVKEGEGRQFVILDAGMNDLVRPAMYDAYHAILPVREPAAASDKAPADFVGPVCETGDTFAKARMTTSLCTDDLVVIKSAGAYGAVMSNSYNTRALIAEVLVKGSEMAVVRERENVDALIGKDKLPNWL